MNKPTLTELLLFDSSALYAERFNPDSVAYPIRRIREKFGDKCQVFIVTDENFEGKIKDSIDVIGMDTVRSIVRQYSSKDLPMVFIVGFRNDELLETFLDIVSGIENVFYFGLNHVYPPARYFQTNKNAEEALRRAEKGSGASIWN